MYIYHVSGILTGRETHAYAWQRACVWTLDVFLGRRTCQVDDVLVALDDFHSLAQHSCLSPEVVSLGLYTIEPKIAPVQDHWWMGVRVARS